MDTEKTAIAARMYIALRREAKRSIDVEWLLKNTEYAREVIALAKQHSQELVELAMHYEAHLPESSPGIMVDETAFQLAAPPPQKELTDRYIGRLR